MKFADPSRCPSCGFQLASAESCAKCSFDLTSVEARRLWQTLLQADTQLAAARNVSQPVQPVPAAPSPDPVAPPVAAASAPRPQRFSTGGIILALGALCLLVAGFIFITVNWGSLGVTGRALVLLAFTAVVGAVAWWTSRRGLRGSAEAMWTVFLGMLTLDWFAAWGQDLFGLRDVSFGWLLFAWSVVIFAAGALIVTNVQQGRHLVMPGLVAGAAPWLGATALGFELEFADQSSFWSGLVVVMASGAFVAASAALAMKLTTWIVAAHTVVAGGALVGVAMVEAAHHPSWSDLISDAHGLPMAVIIAGLVVLALTVEKVTPFAAAAAALGTVYVVAVPMEDQWTDRGGVLVAALAAVPMAAMVRGHGWGVGLRFASAVSAVAALAMSGPWVAAAAESVTSRWFDRGDAAFWAEQTSGTAQNRFWWVPLIAGLAIGAAMWLGRRWPEQVPAKSHLPVAGVAVGLAGMLIAVVVADAPFVVAATVGVLVGAGLTRVVVSLWMALSGLAIAGLAATLALPTQTGTVAVWSLTVTLTAVLAWSSRSDAVRAVASFGASVLAVGTVAQLVNLSGWHADAIALSQVLGAAVVLGLGSIILRTWPGRVGIEAAAAALGPAGLATAAADSSLPWQALVWTILGAAMVVVGLVVADRAWLRWAGSAALGVAYVLRLAASDVDVVEAYSLPYGIFLLGIGWWAMRKPDNLSSLVTLSAGLTLTLVPSLPQALDDPTSLRALLLGGAAIASLIVGVVKRWKAPFLAGVVVVALLAIVSLGPWALAVPRWVLIATTGALLLAVGVTWEDRVRDGRAATRFVGDMR